MQKIFQERRMCILENPTDINKALYMMKCGRLLKWMPLWSPSSLSPLTQVCSCFEIHTAHNISRKKCCSSRHKTFYRLREFQKEKMKNLGVRVCESMFVTIKYNLPDKQIIHSPYFNFKVVSFCLSSIMWIVCHLSFIARTSVFDVKHRLLKQMCHTCHAFSVICQQVPFYVPWPWWRVTRQD